VTLLLVTAWSSGCGKDDKKKSEGDAFDVGTDLGRPDPEVAVDSGKDAGPVATLFPPPKISLRQFTVIAETNSTIGVEGQEFSLSARIGRGFPDGEVSFAWDLDGGKTVTDNGESLDQLTAVFQAPGNYAVEVTATDAAGNSAQTGVLIAVVGQKEGDRVGDVDGDGVVDEEDVGLAESHVGGSATLTATQFSRADLDLNGRLTEFDLELLELASAAAGNAPEIIWPDAGAPGAMVRMIHPALLDAEAVAAIQFAGTDSIVPIRMRPGYAAFVVPPELKANPGGELELLADGEVAAAFAFEVLATPEAPGPAGEELEAALAEAEQLIAMAAPLFDSYCTAVGATAEQRAALVGMVQVATDSFVANREALVEAYGQMDGGGRAALEQVARANGLDDLSQRMSGLKDRLQQTSGSLPLFIDPGDAAMLLDVLCLVHDVNSVAGQVVEVTSIAANYLGWFDWWPAADSPEVAQVVQFMTEQSALLSVLTSLLGAAAQYLPELGEVSISAQNPALLSGDSTAFDGAVALVVTSGICSQKEDLTVAALLEGQLAYALGEAIPLVGQAFETADFLRENMDAVAGLVYDVSEALFGEVLDAANVDAAIAELPGIACAAAGQAALPVSLGELVADCGDVEDGVWTCADECLGGATIDAQASLCSKTYLVQMKVPCGECGPESCAGCCQEGLCVEAVDGDACGANGEECKVCPQYFQCNAGECDCTSDCAGVGDKVCVENELHVCSEVSNDPPCNKTLFSEPCINGTSCFEGECIVECGPENCEGCCLPDQTCMPGDSPEFCGASGEECAACDGPAFVCTGGTCICEQTCADMGWECDTDGCGNDCGTCQGDDTCLAGTCVAPGEVTAVIAVDEGNKVPPLTTLHLNSDQSVAGAGWIIEYQWEVDQPPGATGVFLPSAAAPNPTFTVPISGTYVFSLTVCDKSDTWSEPATYVVTVASQEAIHVELVWDTPGDPDQTDSGPQAGADLDLHFVHPLAEELDLDEDGVPDGYFDNPYDCFWFNAHPQWGELNPDVDDDPGLDIDDSDGAGPENLNLAIPENVTYKIGAHYWNDHGFGPSFATARVYIMGSLVFEMSGVEMAMKDMWDICTIEWPSGTVNAYTDGSGNPKIIPEYTHPMFQ